MRRQDPTHTSRTATQLRRFLREDEDGGSSTIEFVLWLPVFTLILSLIVDVCFMFLGQAVMYEAAADTARRWAIGSIASEEAAEAFARDAASFNGEVPIVSGTTSDIKTVTVSIAYPVSALDVTGVLGFASSDRIEVTVVRLRE